MSLIDDRLLDFFFRYDKALPLDAEEHAVETGEGYSKLHMVFTSTHNERVPATLYLPSPSAGPVPAIMVQHAGPSSKDDAYIQEPCRRWAEAGYACIAIDSPNVGERAGRGRVALEEQWREGLIFQMRDQRVQAVVDLMRALDYLETRPEVDASRTGYVGVSQGAFLGVQLAALDKRVRALVCIVAGGSLRPFGPDTITVREADLVQELTDPARFAPRISPRPVLMLSGDEDEIVPRAATEALYGALRDPKELRWFAMGHTVTPDVLRQAFQLLRNVL